MCFVEFKKAFDSKTMDNQAGDGIHRHRKPRSDEQLEYFPVGWFRVKNQAVKRRGRVLLLFSILLVTREALDGYDGGRLKIN